jgi:hypothetical protein
LRLETKPPLINVGAQLKASLDILLVSSLLISKLGLHCPYKKFNCTARAGADHRMILP